MAEIETLSGVPTNILPVTPGPVGPKASFRIGTRTVLFTGDINVAESDKITVAGISRSSGEFQAYAIRNDTTGVVNVTIAAKRLLQWGILLWGGLITIYFAPLFIVASGICLWKRTTMMKAKRLLEQRTV